MFLKNNIRPAFATANGAGQTVKSRKKADDAIMRNEADETDSFGTFETAPKGGNGGSAGKGNKGGINAKPIIIAALALVVVILLIVVVVAIVANSSKDVKYEDNSFVAFSDENDVYRVAVNGKSVAEYDGEIELIPAADRSFAYVIETTDDGERLYYIDGKGQTEITTSPVTKILVTASLNPGAVWVDADNEGVYLYTEDHGPERMLRDIDSTYAMSDDHCFAISADGETVVYTKIVESNTGSWVDKLYMYNDHSERVLITGHYPQAVSDNGSLVYTSAMAKNAVTDSLYVIPLDDDEYTNSYLIAENFNSIIEMNTKGDELVFTTLDSAEIATYVVAFNIKKMDEEIVPTRIGKGAIYYPVSPSGDVARFSSFSDCYFECELSVDLSGILTGGEILSAPVYYINKNYEVSRISKTAGKFDPDGKYFYTVNQSGNLTYLDLSDSDAMSVKLPSAEGIVDFAVTQKGNVYWLAESGRLMFYDISKDKNTLITDSADAISMYTYSNTLYFTMSDSLSVFCTEEGSKMEKASMGKIAVSGLPVFADTNSKKTFAGFYDAENDEWTLLYTSNGKSFKSLGTCALIGGMNAPTSIQDIVNTVTPPATSGSDTSDTTGNN